jgi:predicted GTPase
LDIGLVICGKKGVGKTSLIEAVKQGAPNTSFHCLEVELTDGLEAQKILEMAKTFKQEHLNTSLKWVVVISLADRALEVERLLLSEGEAKGAFVVLNQIDLAKPSREWNPETFDLRDKTNAKVQNIDTQSTYAKRTLSLTRDELSLCAVPEDEPSFGVDELLKKLMDHKELEAKTNDELPKKNKPAKEATKSSTAMGKYVADPVIEKASRELTDEVIPALDEMLRKKTIIALEDSLNGFAANLRGQLELLLEGQLEASSKVVSQVQELTEQVSVLLDKIGPNAEQISSKFQDISQEVSGVMQQVRGISDGVGRHLDSLAPLGRELTTNIHEAAVPLASLAETLDGLATRLQSLAPPAEAGEPSTIDKVGTLLKTHGALLDELVRVGDKYIELEERRRKFGSEAAMEKMVLLLGSGIFFMMLSRFFSSRTTDAFMLLRVGWGAIAVTGLFTFARPLFLLFGAVKEDRKLLKDTSESVSQMFWKKLHSEDMVGYVFYIIFIFVVSALTLVAQ